MTNELSELVEPIIRIAKAAGDSILHFYENPDLLDVQRKSDQTHITSADLSAHKILFDGLQALTPQWPILSEEGEIPAFEEREQWERYWLLDPLDGTRAFVHHVDEFTVNIALIDNHQSILGVIYLPVKKVCYFAYQGGGAFVQQGDQAPQRIQTKTFELNETRFIVGQYHKSKRIERVLEALPLSQLFRMNSSLKFTQIAEGSADVYPRYGDINEWDIGAGVCILEEAGGKLICFNGQPVKFNATESLLCPPFLAAGDDRHTAELIALFEKSL